MLHGWRESMYGLGQVVNDLLGSTSTMVSGLAATQTGSPSLTINIAAGDIYQLAAIDTTTYGALTSDAGTTMQQGFAAAQALLLTTAGLSSGQSRYALVQATFTQTDVIPADDPNGGLLPYLNTTNPSGPPWSGPSNTGATQPTRRTGVCTVSVIYGAVAATGSEVPPNASAGNVGLYLIDLAFGQTQVLNANILVAGPSVGVGVPGNYPVAPFIAGLLNSHHSGNAGQAPKIKLATETQGSTLPLQGSSSGVVTIGVQAAAGTYNFNLPITAGASGAPLLSGGGGAAAMTYGSVTGSGNFVLSASPTLTGTITAANITMSGDLSIGGGFGGMFYANSITASIPNGNAVDIAMPTGFTNGKAVGKFWIFVAGSVASADFIINSGNVPLLVNNGATGGLTLTAIAANNIRINNSTGSATAVNYCYTINGHP